MLPHDMLKSDVQKLHDVCKRTKGKTLYYAPNKPSLQLGDITIIDAEHLWKPVTEGMCRYWTLRPMAIAETRPIPSPKHNRKWGVQEAICLALGHVWRDRYAPKANQGGQAKASREERYWNFVDAVKAKTSNFRIFDWRAVYRVNMNGNVGLLYASEAEERQLPKATVDPHSNMAIVNRWKKTSFLQNLKDNGKHPFQTRSEKNDAKLNCRRRELFTQNKNRKGGLPQE